MTRWTWRRPAPNDSLLPNFEMETMSTTTYSSPEQKIAGLRDKLTRLATEDAGDPIELAGDANGWARRDQARRDRKLQVAAELQQIQQFGTLLDQPDAMAAIRQYAAATAEARVALPPVVERRDFPGQRLDTKARKHLDPWWKALRVVGAVLPVGLPDAERWLAAELDAWFAARNALAAAFMMRLSPHSGVELPAPELQGDLPGGFIRGVHRAGGAQ